MDTDLKDLGIAVGDPVYYVPSSDAMTKYVFTERIQKWVKRNEVQKYVQQAFQCLVYVTYVDLI